MFQIIALFFVFLPFFSKAQVQLTTPLEILSFMEASGTPYEIEQLYGKHTPKIGPVLNQGIFVENRNGKHYEMLQENLLSCPSLQHLETSRKLLDQERPPYRKIRKLYRKILKESPQNAQVLTLMGQSFFEEKKYKEAKEILEKSLQINPLDYLAHWYLAEIAWENQELDSAINKLMHAHLLNRNHPRLRLRLRQWINEKNMDFRDEWRFDPKYRIYRDTQTQSIVIAADGVWLTYALYKAVWNYEPDYRFIKESQAVTDYLFQEEMEATLGTFFTYEKLQNQDQRQYPAMRALEKALDNEMFEEYVFYEIMLFDRPNLAYYLTDGFRQRLVDYLWKIRIQE